MKSCQKVKCLHETLITGKKFNQYAQNRSDHFFSDPLNVRLVGKIRFAETKSRTLHAVYNLPAKEKENL